MYNKFTIGLMLVCSLASAISLDPADDNMPDNGGGGDNGGGDMGGGDMSGSDSDTSAGDDSNDCGYGCGGNNVKIDINFCVNIGADGECEDDSDSSDTSDTTDPDTDSTATDCTTENEFY